MRYLGPFQSYWSLLWSALQMLSIVIAVVWWQGMGVMNLIAKKTSWRWQQWLIYGESVSLFFWGVRVWGELILAVVIGVVSWLFPCAVQFLIGLKFSACQPTPVSALCQWNVVFQERGDFALDPSFCNAYRSTTSWSVAGWVPHTPAGRSGYWEPFQGWVEWGEVTVCSKPLSGFTDPTLDNK